MIKENTSLPKTICHKGKKYYRLKGEPNQVIIVHNKLDDRYGIYSLKEPLTKKKLEKQT